MKSTIFWDITPCSQLKVKWRFGETSRSVFHPLSCWFARLILWSWRWRRYVPPKRRLTFNGLHGILSKNILLFNIDLYLIILVICVGEYKLRSSSLLISPFCCYFLPFRSEHSTQPHVLKHIMAGHYRGLWRRYSYTGVTEFMVLVHRLALVQWFRLALSKGTNWVGALPPTLSFDDVKWSSFRNVMFF
jgi:hypothetical protein